MKWGCNHTMPPAQGSTLLVSESYDRTRKECHCTNCLNRVWSWHVTREKEPTPGQILGDDEDIARFKLLEVD